MLLDAIDPDIELAEPLAVEPTSGALSSAAEVARLARLDLPGLRAAWCRRYGAPPHLRSARLLRLMLAWRIQAAAWGGLDGETRRRLATSETTVTPGRDLPLGTRLTREWKGAPVEVLVTDGGFCWQGRTYASLSAVARAVTGVRWNGPRFFGLRQKAG